MSKSRLFDEFQEVSAKEWKQKIQVDLKGADYNETLVWESPEGIKVKPFYHQDDATPTASVAPDSDWNIGHAIYVQNAKSANTKAVDALKRGAEDIVFTVASKEIEVSELLQDIPLETTTIYFNFEFLSSNYIQKIIDFVGDSHVNIHLNIDIIGNLAETGNWYFNLKKDHALLEEIQQKVANKKQFTLLSINAGLYQNAGANMAQQLAYAIAHANEYLNHFKEQTKQIVFKVSVSGNYFFEIAKLRALRLLWKSLATEYGIEDNCTILVQPSKRNKTLYDYNVNMLRTTTETMAAALGGADTVCNLPYDAIYHKDNEFGERIARNQLLVLKKESYLDAVQNPAEGAYYIESLTQQLAEKALEIFKNIESKGGYLALLKSHSIQKKIKDSANKEQQLFNDGNEILVGTNKYVNTNDRMKDDLELFPFVKTNPRKTLIEPIIEKRLAETLEQNRLKDE